MKRLIPVVALLMAATVANAQSYIGPESVEYDAANSRYLISNSSNGQIIARDDATTLLTVLVSNTGSGPHGLEVVGGVVYACAGGRVKGYDLSDGTEVANFNLGGQFLNGITSDGAGHLFVTDFSANKIYRVDIATGNFNVMASPPQTPNGIIYDGANNRLVYVEWGNNADINAVSMADSSITELVATNLSNIDGVCMDASGNFYVSSWGADAIHSFNNDFTVGPSTVVTGMDGPADLYLHQGDNVIGIPNSGNNTVVFFDLNTVTAVEATEETTVYGLYPNVTSQSTMIVMDAAAPGQSQVMIYDNKGSQVTDLTLNYDGSTVRHNLDVSGWAVGIYNVVFVSGSNVQQHQLIIQR